MNTPTTIICPNCNATVDVSEALSHKMKDEIRKEYDARFLEAKDQLDKEKEQLLTKEKELLSMKLEQELKIQALADEMLKKEKQEMERRFKAEHGEQWTAVQTELNEKNEQLKDLFKLQASLTKLERDKELLEEKLKSEAEMKYSEKLAQELQQQKQELQTGADLKIKDLQRKLVEQTKLTDEMKKKQTQGSEQAQGETQEVVMEEFLKAAFPTDEIIEIQKGKNGADVLHVVKTSIGNKAGSVLYESKRTQNFNNEWISKLKADMVREKADLAVLVTSVYPKDIERISLIDGVWVCSLNEFKGLCRVLRDNLLKLHQVKCSQENKDDKMSLLYEYLTSDVFRNQIITILTGFSELHEGLNKEKAAMLALWKKREMSIDKVLNGTSAMYGQIQGISSNSLAPIEMLELPEMVEIPQ